MILIKLVKEKRVEKAVVMFKLFNKAVVTFGFSHNNKNDMAVMMTELCNNNTTNTNTSTTITNANTNTNTNSSTTTTNNSSLLRLSASMFIEMLTVLFNCLIAPPPNAVKGRLHGCE